MKHSEQPVCSPVCSVVDRGFPDARDVVKDHGLGIAHVYNTAIDIHVKVNKIIIVSKLFAKQLVCADEV